MLFKPAKDKLTSPGVKENDEKITIEKTQILQQRKQLTSKNPVSEQPANLYFRSAHTLTPGIQSLSLVSDVAIPSNASFVSFSDKVDNLSVKSICQNTSFPKECEATVSNVNNLRACFKLGQKFGSLSVLLLLLLASMFSLASAQIVVSDFPHAGPQIQSVGYDCNDPVAVQMLDKHSRCRNSKFPVPPDKPELYDLLAHPVKN